MGLGTLLDTVECPTDIMSTYPARALSSKIVSTAMPHGLDHANTVLISEPIAIVCDEILRNLCTLKVSLLAVDASTLFQGQDWLKGRCWSAGLRLAAVSDQHGKSRRTLFAVFIQELSGLSERELAQQLLTLLKHLPLIGTAH